MITAEHPLLSRYRSTNSLSPLDPRFICTGKWRRTSSRPSSSSPNYNFLKNCNGSWRRTSSPIPDHLKNFNCTTSQRRRPSLLKEASACPKQPKKKEMFGGVLEESMPFSSTGSPSPSSLPIPSFVRNNKRVTFNMDDQALDLELMEFGFFVSALN